MKTARPMTSPRRVINCYNAQDDPTVIEREHPMAATTDSVFDAALALPCDERVKLVERLIDSIPANVFPFEDEWIEEANARSREIDECSVTLIPWSKARTTDPD